jgi:hypothetical protein
LPAYISSLANAAILATFERIGARLPVGRVGKPEDIAEAYLYLMKTGFSTGETVVVDGGALRHRNLIGRSPRLGRVTVPSEHQVSGAPDVDFGYHAEKVNRAELERLRRRVRPLSAPIDADASAIASPPRRTCSLTSWSPPRFGLPGDRGAIVRLG